MHRPTIRRLLTVGSLAATMTLTLTTVTAEAAIVNSPSLTKVTLAVPDAIMNWPVEYYMGQTNICNKYGLDVSTNVTTPTAQAAGITSGSVQFAVGGSQVWEAPLKHVNNVKLIADAGTFPGTGIEAVKSIKDVDALHQMVKSGKTFIVAATTPGGLAELTPVLMLEHDGFTLGKDFSVVYLGQASAISAAFVSGRVQVGDNEFPPIPQEQAAGIHKIQTLPSVPSLAALFENFIGVTSTYLNQNPSTVTGFLKCFKAAAQAVRAPKNRSTLVQAETKYVTGGASYINKWIGQVVPLTSEIIPTKNSTLVGLMKIFLNYPQAQAASLAPGLISNKLINAAHINFPAETAQG